MFGKKKDIDIENKLRNENNRSKFLLWLWLRRWIRVWIFWIWQRKWFHLFTISLLTFINFLIVLEYRLDRKGQYITSRKPTLLRLFLHCCIIIMLYWSVPSSSTIFLTPWFELPNTNIMRRILIDLLLLQNITFTRQLLEPKTSKQSRSRVFIKTIDDAYHLRSTLSNRSSPGLTQIPSAHQLMNEIKKRASGSKLILYKMLNFGLPDLMLMIKDWTRSLSCRGAHLWSHAATR